MKDSNKTPTADIAILLAVMFVSAYMFAVSSAFAAETKLFPQIVSVAVFICCAAKLALTIRVFLFRKNTEELQKGTAPGKSVPITRNQTVLLAVSVLYVALLKPVGFLLCTIAVLLVLPCLLGYRRWTVLVPFAVIITLAFYAIFRYGFYIKLPAGVLAGLL